MIRHSSVSTAASKHMIRVSSLPPAMALSPLTHLDSFFDLPPKHCIISFTDPVVPVTSDSKFGLSYETHSDNPRQFCFLTVYKSSGWASSRFYFSSGSLISVWGVLVFVTFTCNLLDTSLQFVIFNTIVSVGSIYYLSCFLPFSFRLNSH